MTVLLGWNWLSVMPAEEHSIRYQGELRQKAWRTYQDNGGSEGEREEDRSMWWRRGGNSYWLAATIISRFDTNRNGRLEVTEVKELGMPVGQIDINLDGELSREEMYSYLEPIQKRSR